MSEYFPAMLNGGMLVCSLMAIVWLLRIRSKGATAYLMASAFVVFAALLYAIREEGAMWIRYVLGSALALLLGADVAYRAARQAADRSDHS